MLSTGCTSSTDALGYAARLIRSGDADVLLSGGADGCVTPGMIFGFSRMRAVSTRYNDRPAEASRPFDRGRDGFVLGEGAWMYVVEARGTGESPRRVHLRDRRRLPLDLRRLSSGADGSRMAPRSSRPCAAPSQRSHRALEEIGYVNYHGTSTQLNDAIESQCTRRVFGRWRSACRGRRPSR